MYHVTRWWVSECHIEPEAGLDSFQAFDLQCLNLDRPFFLCLFFRTIVLFLF